MGKAERKEEKKTHTPKTKNKTIEMIVSLWSIVLYMLQFRKIYIEMRGERERDGT